MTLENARRAADARAAEELALRTSEKRFRSLVGNAGDVIVIIDREGVISYQSPAAERVWGFRADQLIGTSLAPARPRRRSGRPRCTARRHSRSGGRKDAHRRAAADCGPDGSWRLCEILMNNLLRDPGVAGIVATFHDVTERKAFENQLSHLALHDPLSGLPNRALFLDRLERALCAPPRTVPTSGGAVP